jgi:RNA polymerase sigma-70 factor (ECF subfamily)
LVTVMDAEGFEAWYRTEHPRLVSALTVVARDASVAADVTDEAFARALERWARVQSMASRNGWVFRTALNVLRRRYRRRALEARLLRRVATTEVHRPIDWSAETWDALARLPHRERVAVALKYVADLTTDEIALAMGVAPGTVGSTLHSARARLGITLAETEPEGQPSDA